MARQASPALAHGAALLLGDARGRRFLDHLLVAALHGAVALAQVDRVAVAVGQHLELHVPGPLQELLHIHRVVAEGRVASVLVMPMAVTRAASLCTTRMPRPPPPPAALMITG